MRLNPFQVWQRAVKIREDRYNAEKAKADRALNEFEPGVMVHIMKANYEKSPEMFIRNLFLALIGK